MLQDEELNEVIPGQRMGGSKGMEDEEEGEEGEDDDDYLEEGEEGEEISVADVIVSTEQMSVRSFCVWRCCHYISY